jgi:hypothetical protein
MREKGSFSDSDICIFLSQSIASFGVKQPFESQTAREHFSNRALTKVILEIKQYLQITCHLKAVYVKGNVYPYLTRASFVSDNLKAAIREEMHLSEHIPAVTIIPGSLPLYGTSGFEQAECILAVNFYQMISRPYEAFAYCIAHELVHIILESTRHPLRFMETAVDLTAMLLGFCEIIRLGSFFDGVETGYLTLHQRELAYTEIKRLL